MNEIKSAPAFPLKRGVSTQVVLDYVTTIPEADFRHYRMVVPTADSTQFCGCIIGQIANGMGVITDDLKQDYFLTRNRVIDQSINWFIIRTKNYMATHPYPDIPTDRDIRSINDSEGWASFPQPTIKGRVVAFLEDMIKAGF